MSGAEALRWGLSPADSLPYVEVRHHQLRGGFTHRLGSRVGQHLNLELHFVDTRTDASKSLFSADVFI